MRTIRIKEHEGYYFAYDENDSSIPVTVYSNWKKTGRTPAVIDESFSRPLRSADDRDRLYVTIATMNKKERLYLDTLVTSYLISNPNSYKRVIHKDNNFYNCHPSNLQWASESEYRIFAQNTNRSKVKKFEVIYKDGRKEIVTGFLDFLEKNNLTEHSLYRLRKGEISEYNGIISFEDLGRTIKGRNRRKDSLQIDLTGYDIVELNDWPGYYIVYKKNDSSERIRIFSKWKKDKDKVVLSEDFVRETTQHLHKTGYYQVNMKLPGQKKIVKKFHRLIAQQLVENPNPDLFDTVDHIDWNKTNNHPSNLQWMTLSENSKKGGNPEKKVTTGTYEITFSDGRKEVIQNLKKLCDDRGYNRASLRLMILSKQQAHKDITNIKKLQEVLQ